MRRRYISLPAIIMHRAYLQSLIRRPKKRVLVRVLFGENRTMKNDCVDECVTSGLIDDGY